MGTETSKPYDITSGILQGDIISPLLFALFVSDFDSFLSTRGIEGVAIDGMVSLISLFYADDQVLLADSPHNMNRALAALYEYCLLNKLTVNAAKSKVLVFQRKGKQAQHRFWCGSEELEKVSSYTYLGVVFSRSGVFAEQARHAVSRGTAAYKNIWPIIFKSRAAAPEAWCGLFSGAVASTSLYGAEIWGYSYAECLERVQVRAFKSLLGLAFNTPDYVVRSELGLCHLKFFVAKAMFGWWIKLLGMPRERLPRVCFERLMVISVNFPDQGFNWALQLRSSLGEAGLEDLWFGRDAAAIKKKKPEFLDCLRSNLLRADLEKAASSSFNYCPRASSRRVGQYASYLSDDLPLFSKRLLCQIRCANPTYCRITLHRIKNLFDSSATCSICNSNGPDSLFHLIAACPVYTYERFKFFGFPSFDENYFFTLLLFEDIDQIRKLVGFLQTVLRQRAFTINEGFLID